jgi:hypothetical protein
MFGQNWFPLNPTSSNSPLRAKNAPSVRARVRAREIWPPIGRAFSHSPNIVPFPLNQKSQKSSALVRLATSAAALPCRQGSSLPPDTRFVPGFAAVLEKPQFLWSGTFYPIFALRPTLSRHSG